MHSVPLRNQISPFRRDWSNLFLPLRLDGSGVLFEKMTLDERIGPEVVALLIDSEPDELLRRKKFDLNLKAGIAATDFGPVLFLVWWILPFVNGRPSAFYEQLLNPLHAAVSVILRRLQDQTHLHVVLKLGCPLSP